MVIKYVAFTWQGQKVEGVLPVEREEEAVQILNRDELIPYRLVPVRPRRSLVQILPFLFQPPAQELVEFNRGTAALLRSGVPLRDALLIFQGQSRSLGLREVLRQVIRDIEGGGRFSDACAGHPAVFPNFYVRLLRLSEATGGVSSTMQILAEAMAKRKALRDKIKSALVYPALSFVVAVIASFILVTYALPSIIGLLQEFQGQLPFLTRLLISMSEFMQLYKFHIMAVVVVVLGAGWLYTRTPRGAKVRDYLVLRLPVIGAVVLRNNLFSLTSTFSTLLQAGVAPVEALQLSQEGLTNIGLREAVGKVREKVVEGTRLGEAFREQRLFPPLLAQGIVTGEAGGTLAPTLRALSDYYEQEATRSVSAATELIQPVVLMLVAAFVGFVAVAVVSGIYSTIGAIK